MSDRPASTRRRALGFAALLIAGVLLVPSLAACGGDDASDSGSSREESSREERNQDSREERSEPETTRRQTAAEQVNEACAETDLAPVERAVADFVDAAAAAESVTTEDEAVTAFLGFLNSGSDLFLALASSLDGFFVALADATGQPEVADLTGDLEDAAADFADLADELEASGTIEGFDVTKLEEIGLRLSEVGETLEIENDLDIAEAPACADVIAGLEDAFAELE